MSDLLARLAARAIGASVTATPPPVPRFAADPGPDAATPPRLAVPPPPGAVEVGGPPGRAATAPGIPVSAPHLDRPTHPGPHPTTATPHGPSPVPGPADGVAVPPRRTRVATSGDPTGTSARDPSDRDPASSRAEPIAAGPTGSPHEPIDEPATGAAVVAARPDRPDGSSPLTVPHRARPVAAGPVAPPTPQEPAEQPTMRVHIGRLDVRVAPPPTPTRRARTEQPTPGTNLAEYLQGHRGDR